MLRGERPGSLNVARSRSPGLSISARLAFGCGSAQPHARPLIHIRSPRLRLRLAQPHARPLTLISARLPSAAARPASRSPAYPYPLCLALSAACSLQPHARPLIHIRSPRLSAAARPASITLARLSIIRSPRLRHAARPASRSPAYPYPLVRLRLRSPSLTLARLFIISARPPSAAARSSLTYASGCQAARASPASATWPQCPT